jgi:flagellar hook-basal body complex protein FliE
MSQIQGISSIGSAAVNVVSAGSTNGAAASDGFLDSLKTAIGKVNDVEIQASQAVDGLMTGQTQDLHRTMVALQQADVSFQLMMQIRNKLISAYEEIQRMQI